MIKVDIVEVTGRTFESVKFLGMLPTSVPDSEFNVYVRWHADGRVTVDRSDTDETLLTVGLTRLSKGAAFAQLMEDLATLYGMPVQVACDPGVSGGQSGKMVGTYLPREAEATPVINKAAILAKPIDSLLNPGAAEATMTPEAGDTVYHERTGHQGVISDVRNATLVVSWHDGGASEDTLPGFTARGYEVIPAAEVAEGLSAAFTPTMEEIIWAQTYTMIKPCIRTKLAKRSRKSARRARRGCKGGVR